MGNCKALVNPRLLFVEKRKLRQISQQNYSNSYMSHTHFLARIPRSTVKKHTIAAEITKNPNGGQ